MTTLFLIRHGNTFDKGDTILRVGGRTDLPLSISGQTQVAKLGQHLKDQGVQFDACYSGPLLRHRQTAEIMNREMAFTGQVKLQEQFSEVDYGIDEGKPEAEVEVRLGAAALSAWNTDSRVPDGWQIDLRALRNSWIAFAEHCQNHHADQTVALVSSGGTLRFAFDILPDPEAARAEYGGKVSTGAYCVLTDKGPNGTWQVQSWNLKAGQ